MQSKRNLIADQVMAVAYSGFREGQHPDRGEGANNPSKQEILEDLHILIEHNFTLIRLYDSGQNSADTLSLIRQHQLPIKVLLGIWLDAEISNHDGCPWLTEPISESVLSKNKLQNGHEIERAISLANDYADIIVSVNVGNEALVSWNDHMVPVDTVIDYVKLVKQHIQQPVTVAENYAWWIEHGQALANIVDYIGVHTYPMWEHKLIEEGLAYTLDNIHRVHEALPQKPIAVLEGGWATTAEEFPEQANCMNQQTYFEQVYQWANKANITFFFFEAFDEPWKGHPDAIHGAEKHWGLFYVDRTPKQVMKRLEK
ncbi:glycosyl hydrolase [Alteromonas sediminis]|uniref:Endo-1,3-beta-glucanase btgC n=1 Tax=Alteromonas sediminis TaxID=2259342 RepID=A0A3N5Y0C4_9ALTE|nr:glycosyl hydrolase 53 family protein [Alteromonas sediminis]RPJ67097.1 glycosyl hydrolase [Alteromonas sediminis]